MSYKLDNILIVLLQVVVSIVSAVILSCLITIVPMLRFFTYVAEYSIGLGVSPLIASSIFFSLIFVMYSIISRTCRLGPLVCTIMCIIVLALNSPITYLAVVKLGYASSTIAGAVGTLLRGFYVSPRDLIYVSILCVASTIMLIMSRVIENMYAIGEIATLKRVPVIGSVTSLLLTSLLTLIFLSFIAIGSLLMFTRLEARIPVSTSLISIGALSLLVMTLLLARGRR
ncbi:MAG: hypothetical protein GXO23_06050 [Crenarchaeota archaeon]|nr:hypothetical protein [Thermoproteota archaeon]